MSGTVWDSEWHRVCMQLAQICFSNELMMLLDFIISLFIILVVTSAHVSLRL